MMRHVIESSIKFRGLVIAAAIGLLVLGYSQLSTTTVDTLPEFKPTIVEVQTEALGLSAEEVEQLITVPLEQDLLNGIAFLDEIESVSLPGLSSVVMTFEPGTDLLDARQIVAERLTQAVGVAGLPEVAKPPQMLQPLSSTSRVSMVKLTSGELSPIEVSVLARWVIAPRLLGVHGVANVAIWGQRERQLQVLVDPERLQAEGVSLLQVIRTTGNALEVSPLSFLEASAPGTGGFIDTLSQRLQVFHEQAINTPDELARVTMEDEEGDAVFIDGEPLILGDVTTVVEDHQPLIGDALCTDGDCLLLVIEKFPDSNTIDVAEGIDRALDVMKPGLPGLEIDTNIYRPAEFVESSFVSLRTTAIASAILLVLVLAAITMSWRKVLVVVAVTAASLVTAYAVLALLGVTMNLMVVAGLAIASALLVDDAVTDTEEVARRLEGHRPGEGLPAWQKITTALIDTRSAAMYGSLVMVVVAVPLFFFDGVAGAFLPPQTAAFLLAVGASLLAAMTLTPALAMLALRTGAPTATPATRWMTRVFDRASRPLMATIRPALIVFVAFIVLGAGSLLAVDTMMNPVLEERDVLIQMEAAPGTSLTRMNEITAGVVEDVAGIDGIRNVGAHVGRAITSDQIVNVNSAEVWTNIAPDADYKATLAAIRAAVADEPGLTTNVLTYSEERIADILQRTDHDIVVRVYGEDPSVLEAKAAEIEGAITGIDGLTDVQIDRVPDEPTIEVVVDLERAQAQGVKPGDVRRAAAILIGGLAVGNLFEEQKVFDVVVWGEPDLRDSADDVRNLLIDTPGGHVTVGDVADVNVVPNPTVIKHESVASYLDVVGTVSGRSATAVAADVDAAVAGVAFPLEHHAELLGAFADRQSDRTVAIGLFFGALVLALLLFQAAFASWKLAILAMLALPAAVAGTAVAVVVTGGVIGLGFVTAVLAVVGLAARHAAALIRRYQQLQRDEGLPFGVDLVRRGTRDRLIAMATSAAAVTAVFLPAAIAPGAVGFEILQPAAVAIIGGVVTLVPVMLLVLPVAYLRFGYIEQPETWHIDLLTEPVAELESHRGMGV